MDHQEILDRYIKAWNQGAVAQILRLMDPQAWYHERFWGETCTGRDLVRYFDTIFATDRCWYELDEALITTPTGFIFRYLAYDRSQPRKRKLIYKGAEVVTVADGLITGISDFYCDPNPVQLLEVATRIEERRQASNVARLGLSGKISGHIKRRLSELGDHTTIFLESDLNPSQLADRIGCTVSHLFHVLEEEKETTFRKFVNDWRIHFAATLLTETPERSINIGQIASQSGFANLDEFEMAFQSVFGMSAAEYASQNDHSAARPNAEEPAIGS